MGLPFFVMLFAYGALMSYAIAGQQPYQATVTATAISSSATTVTVASTAGFPSEGLFQWDSEIARYTGKTATTFTGLTRGAHRTAAVAHQPGTVIRSHELGILNDLLGFGIIENLAEGNKVQAAVALPLGIIHAVVMVLTANWPWLQGHAGILRVFVAVLQVGLVTALWTLIFKR